MSVSMSIRPQYTSDGKTLMFSCGEVSSENANCLNLNFSSYEYNDKEKNSPFTVNAEISLFYLSDATAQLLSKVGRMSEPERVAALRILNDGFVKAGEPANA